MSVMNGDISEVVFEIFKGFQLNYTDTTVSFPKLLTFVFKNEDAGENHLQVHAPKWEVNR